MTNRRQFLQTTAAITGASLLPNHLFIAPTPTFLFIQSTTLNSWSIANPTQWCLDHQHDPLLERAKDRLCTLTSNDSDRIIRLVVRRCGLNLLELQTNQVTVHHWSKQHADLRPFFKTNGFTRPKVEVTLLARRDETITHKTGDDFLYGTKIAQDFPIELFVSKWNNRFVNESDDQQASPTTNSGLAWEGLEDGEIPWAALKSAWQRSQAVSCLNCDQPTILVQFGLKQVGMSNRLPNFLRVCPKCNRSFADDTIESCRGWMKANLDADVYPKFEIVWGTRFKPKSKS